MNDSDVTLVLKSLGLEHAPQGSVFVEATGTVQASGGALGPGATVRVGRGIPVPPAFKARLPEAEDSPVDETALLLTFPTDDAVRADRPTWLAMFSANGVRLHASVPLHADELSIPDLIEFDADALLVASLEVTGSTLRRASVHVSGTGRLTGPLGPAEPASLRVTQFSLSADLEALPALGSVLQDPAQLLDAAFRGELNLSCEVTGLSIGAVECSGGTATLDLTIRSEARSRDLQVGRVGFALDSPGPLELREGAGHLAGLTISQVHLHGTMGDADREDVHLDGAAAVVLPDVLGSVLVGSPAAGAAAIAGLSLHRTAGRTDLTLRVEDLSLDSSLALIDLPRAALLVRLAAEDGAWRLRIGAEGRLSWGDLGDRLEAAGIATLPTAAAMPEVMLTGAVEVTAAGGRASLSAELVRTLSDGTSQPYAGPLGLLPVDVAGVRLVVETTFDSSGVAPTWVLTGGGRLSTTLWLHDLVPLRAAQIACSVSTNDGPTRLALVVDDGLPPLRLPSFDGATRELFQVEQLVLEVGDELRVAGRVRLVDTGALDLVGRLQLPAPLSGLVGRLTPALPDVGRLELRAPLGGPGPAQIDVVLTNSSAPTFHLLEEIGRIVNPTGRPPDGTTLLPELGVPDDFFEATPGELRLAATLGDDPALALTATLDCAVLGESFDFTVKLEARRGEPRLLLAAGSSDPIRIRVPAPDARAILGTADVDAIATSYDLDTAQRQALRAVHDTLVTVAEAVRTEGGFVFEVSDFGLLVDAGVPTVSGDVRLISFPRLLELAGPLPPMKLRLGSTTEQIFVSMEMPDATEPLLRATVPGGTFVDVYVGRFMLAYAWGRNEFAFALDAAVVPERRLDLTTGGSGVLLPGVDADVQLGATATAPPVPVPQGRLTFPAPGAGPSSAADELGLQAVVGSDQGRHVTAYLREIAFNPTMFLLWPGARGDAGLIIGGPDPATFGTAQDYLDARTWPRDTFFARATATGATLVVIDPVVGLVLNPLAFIPPFLTANPPYWLVPPLLMGDLYGEQIGVSLNLPGLAFFDLVFERPLPAFSLHALLELAALVAGGFRHRLPAGSPLRGVLYANLSLAATLDVPGLSSAETTVTATLDVNVADFVDGAIDLLHKAKSTLDGAGDLVEQLRDDPGALVRMVPVASRRFMHAVEVGGFSLSGSVLLLTGEELRAELDLFFHNRRVRPRGVAANVVPPEPSAEPVVNQPVDLVAQIVTERVRVLDAFAARPAVAVLAAGTKDRAASETAQRHQALEAFAAEQREHLLRTVEQITAELTRIPIGDNATRSALLHDIQLGDVAGAVEQAVRDAVGSAPGGVDLPGRLRTTISDVLEEVLVQQASYLVGDGALSSPPEQLASDLVNATLIQRPSGQAGLGLRDEHVRIAEISSRFHRPIAVRDVSGAFESLQRRLPDLADADARTVDRVVDDFERELTDVIARTHSVRYVRADALHEVLTVPTAVPQLVEDLAARTWTAAAMSRTDRLAVATFDGAEIATQLERFGEELPAPPTDASEVEEVNGYRIGLRDGSHPTWGVPLPSAGATYAVRLRGGRYQVVVLTAGGWVAQDLPGALVASIPEGLDKADRLRAHLAVVEIRRRRAPTLAEMDAVAPRYDEAPGLYLTGLLSRPEYVVKTSGGVHGPLYVADLLRDPATGSYTVPARPALLAGLSVDLFGNRVSLGGMVVASADGPDLFLFGHSSVRATIDGLTAAVTGEFSAVHGDLWRGVSMLGGSSTPEGVIAVTGHAALLDGTRTILEGATRGTFTRSNGTTTGDLHITVAAEGSVDVGIGELRFMRIAYEVHGDVDVQLGTGGISVSVRAQATTTIKIATYATRVHEVVPAVTVCADVLVVESLWPPRAKWEQRCLTTPAVTVTLPDFSAVQWQPLPSQLCAVHATVSSTGLRLELDLTPFDGQIAGAILDRVELPDLL